MTRIPAATCSRGSRRITILRAQSEAEPADAAREPEQTRDELRAGDVISTFRDDSFWFSLLTRSAARAA